MLTVDLAPERIWQFYIVEFDRLKSEQVVTAFNSDTNHTICVSVDGSDLTFYVYDGDNLVHEEIAVSAYDAEDTARFLTNKYLVPLSEEKEIPKIAVDKSSKSVKAGRISAADKARYEDEIEDREANLREAAAEFLTTVLRCTEDDLDHVAVDDVVDTTCELLTAQYGAKIYRPIIIDEDTEKEEYIEYPYN